MADKILLRNVTGNDLKIVLPGFERDVEAGTVIEITEELATTYAWSEGVWEIERPVQALAPRPASKKEGV